MSKYTAVDTSTVAIAYLNDPAFQSAAFKALVKRIYDEIRRSGSSRQPAL
jgi:hypothetical protein